MKASELIKVLEQAIRLHGDLPVLMDHEIDWAPAPVRLSSVHELTSNLEAEEKPTYLTFDVNDESETILESFSRQLKEIKGAK